ncbi:hypothetical protein Acr_00g0095590 [Actinidia rufa]|uniref:Uncharacterized protein n=1 Tax=Actinidia rufa TaxID=165716 RepID=A0A7J0DYG0_9ERIC|nr:hypothetical protein Acr_00g0095590 [Actinidia rufa]
MGSSVREKQLNQEEEKQLPLSASISTTQADITTPLPTVPTTNIPATTTTPTVTTPVFNPAVSNPTDSTAASTSPSGGSSSWCVASQSASQTALQVALDYACGYGGLTVLQFSPAEAVTTPIQSGIMLLMHSILTIGRIHSLIAAILVARLSLLALTQPASESSPYGQTMRPPKDLRSTSKMVPPSLVHELLYVNNNKATRLSLLLSAIDLTFQRSDDLQRSPKTSNEAYSTVSGVLDLGFGFNYEEILELCNTLLALELYYSMNQRFLDDQQKLPEAAAETCSSGSDLIANWKISSPGE